MATIRNTSEILLKDLINLLDNNGFKGAKNETQNALEHYSKKEYGPCILKIHMAFESVMKTILEEFEITIPNKKTGTLITALHKHKIMHPTLDNYAHSLKNLFEKGLPNIRNQEGISHGQGKEIKKINESYADFAISQASSLISHLIKRYNEKKGVNWLKKSNKVIEKIKTKLSGSKCHNTVKTHGWRLRNFFLELKKDPDNITEQDIINYFRKCKKKYSVKTLYVDLSVLKSLTNDLQGKQFDYRNINKIAGIGKFPSGRTTKKIKPKEYKLMLKNEPNPKHEFWLKFIWWTGVTTRQFINVKISHVKQNPIKITNGKEWIAKARLPDFLWVELQDFIKKRHNGQSPYLFVGYNGGLIAARTLQNAILLAGKRAGIRRNITCRILRISNEKKKVIPKNKNV